MYPLRLTLRTPHFATLGMYVFRTVLTINSDYNPTGHSPTVFSNGSIDLYKEFGETCARSARYHVLSLWVQNAVITRCPIDCYIGTSILLFEDTVRYQLLYTSSKLTSTFGRHYSLVLPPPSTTLFVNTVVPPYPRVIRYKSYRGYVKPRTIPNATHNVIFV
jgi:hypothetical protein